LKKRNKYLAALERFNIEPNFWCAQEYFDKAGWKVWIDDGVVGYVLSDEHPMLSPVGLVTGIIYDTGVLRWGVWALFPGEFGDFLDYNFIYDSKRFLDLSGGDFQTFRKNSRKFINRNPDKKFVYRDASDKDDLTEFLLEWLEKKEGVIHDDEVIIKYLESGENRKVLVDENDVVYGVNIWDENYCYINYRYCFCKPGQYLSEYLRLLFYTSPEVQLSGKLVNDGGCLGDDNLFKFKMKLNPVKINKIYTGLR